MNNPRATFLWLTLLSGLFSAAQALAGASISAQPTSRSVEIGEVLVIAISVSSDAGELASQPELGNVPQFRVVNIRETSRRQSIRMGTGVGMQVSVEMEYQVQLQAVQEGEALFDAISITADGERYTAEAFRVNVLPRVRQPDAPQPPPQRVENPWDAPSARTRMEQGVQVFVDVLLDTHEPYVGEQVEARFILYAQTPPGIGRWDPSPLGPNFFSGFTAEHVDTPSPNQWRVPHGRNTYMVTEVRRTLLFPIREGRLDFDEVGVQVQIPQGFFHAETTHARTNRFDVNVRPWPQDNRPAAFGGAVGQFDFKAEVDNPSPSVGGGFMLRLTIWGHGNIKAVGAPPLPEVSGLRRSREYSRVDGEPRQGRMFGTAVFEYVFTPLAEGEVVIPSIPFAYFDPRQEAYETLESEPIILQVQPRDQLAMDDAVVLSGGVERTVIHLETEDFRHISGVMAGGPNQGRPLPSRAVFWAALLLPLLGLIGSAYWLREQQRMNSDEAYARRQGASRAARKALKEARAAQDTGDANAFYGALSRALQGFIRDRLHIPAVGMTRPELRHALLERKVSGDLIDATLDFLSDLDRFRFAGEDAQTRKDALQAGEALMARWERVR